jgi:predicted GNAT superfamily acetyltransferase
MSPRPQPTFDARDGDVSIRDCTAMDYDGVLRLNEASIPAVNRITREDLVHLHTQSLSLRVATVGELIAGFLLALRHGANYGSPNYRWFSENYESFGYVDRVVVGSLYRSGGVGRMLYEDLRGRCSGLPVLCCEVNLRPPNAGSLAFHHVLGFREVGQQTTEDGAKRVSLQALALGDAVG